LFSANQTLEKCQKTKNKKQKPKNYKINKYTKIERSEKTDLLNFETQGNSPREGMSELAVTWNNPISAVSVSSKPTYRIDLLNDPYDRFRVDRQIIKVSMLFALFVCFMFLVCCFSFLKTTL
jgi:hypothetical protein